MKLRTVIIILIVLLIAAVGFYWYFFMRIPDQIDVFPTPTQNPGGFDPFDRTQPTQTSVPTGSNVFPTDTPDGSGTSTPAALPKLRLLSNTPVGGYGASTTPANTKLALPAYTTVRWVDRGRGNIYETRMDSLDIKTLSNTVFPKIYESWWNRNLTTFIAQYLESNLSEISTVSANIMSRPSAGTTTMEDVNQTEYELRGNTLNLSPVNIAVSPKGDRVFYMTIENGVGVGYVSSFTGLNPTKIFETALTQVTSDWPEENTIVITTKGSSAQSGYAYFVNPTTKVWRKIIGPLPGLSVKVSKDAKYALISASGSNKNILTSIYDVSQGSGTDAIIRTLADKCTWGNFYKELIYCAVPSQNIPGTYPDDWYKGTLSTVDKIWQINARTGEIHLVSSIVDKSDRVIDAFNLNTDQNDNYLYFMNKNDLSLWSLDLVE